MLKRVTSGFSALVLSLTSLFVFAPAIASAAVDVCTWNGSVSLVWSNADNWDCATDTTSAPGAGDSLVFNNTGLLLSAMTLDNDIVGGSFANITFEGTGSNGFTVTGNAFALTGAISITTENGYATFTAPVALSGDKTLSLDGFKTLTFAGNLTGSGAITKTGTGNLYLEGDNSEYSGAITISGGGLGASSKGLATSGGTTIANGANLGLNGCEPATYLGNITLTGASSRPSGEYPAAKLFTSSGPCTGGGGVEESYGNFTANNTTTISGNITLGSDITFSSYSKITKFTGAISGNHKMVIEAGNSATIVVESSANTSGMPNGTYKSETIQKTLTDTSTATLGIYGNTVVTVNGKRGNTTVIDGGTLKGSGTVGDLNVGTGAYLAPGNSPGCLSSSNLSMTGTYVVEIGGTAACTGYDQMKVTGTVDLTNGLISAAFVNKYQPVAGAKYTIIDNDGADKITGTLKDLAEGATFKTPSGTVLKISYVGGDGNDVTLTVVSVGTPDTGFGMLLNSPLTILAAATLAAGAILMMSRRLAPATAKRSRR